MDDITLLVLVSTVGVLLSLLGLLVETTKITDEETADRFRFWWVLGTVVLIMLSLLVVV